MDRNKIQNRQAQQALRLAVIPSLLALVIGYSGSALAVQSGVVVAGSGSIGTKGANTTVSQLSDKMVVNWKSFDIGKNESVTFNQPTSSSAVLNRVTSADPTRINGALTANGRVFVVNPSGVMFGKAAKVDVGSLVATTLNVDDKQFMNSGAQVLNLEDHQGSGVVSNDGQIHATETVALLGSQAINRGTIRAKDVTLGAASGVSMETTDSGYKVNLTGAARDALAANYGEIFAQNGNIELSAAATGAALATVVKNTGTLEATMAGPHSGDILLASSNDGSISVGGNLKTEGSIEIGSASYYSPLASGGEYALDNSHGITIAKNATLDAGSGLAIVTKSGDVVLNSGALNGGVDTTTYVAGNNITVNDRIVNSGRVYLDGGQDVTINAPIKVDSLKVVAGGNLVQNSNVSGDDVSLHGGDVTLNGVVKANNEIEIAADRTTVLNGKLKAPSIVVPEDTQNLAGNTAGNVITTPL